MSDQDIKQVVKEKYGQAAVRAATQPTEALRQPEDDPALVARLLASPLHDDGAGGDLVRLKAEHPEQVAFLEASY